MRRVTVTGAGGFIGGHLVSFLRQKGFWVRGVDRQPPAFPAPSREDQSDEFLLLDLTQSDACSRAMEGAELVFALAANMGGIGWTHAAPAQIMHDNLLISANSIEACRRAGVRTTVYTSSACVYPMHLQDHPQSPPLREDPVLPADPDQAYGWEKLTAEILASSYRAAHGLDIKIARLHAIYGPRGAYTGIRAKSLAALCGKVSAIEGQSGEIEIWGDGTQTRSYCFVDDCVEGLWRLAESDVQVPINLGSEERVSIADLVDRIAELAGKKVTPIFRPDRPVGARGRVSDNARCRELLGWAPATPLATGLAKTYAWIDESVQPVPAETSAEWAGSV